MKYSVIIPVYNAEGTLRRCLDSLLPQLNSDIEVLLINDGSTDASGEICKEYAAKNSCFRYFEQENAGVSCARNKGIDNATGDYVLFIDSDDYVSGDMFCIIDKTLEKFDYDYAVFSSVVNDGKSEHITELAPFSSKDIDVIIPKISDMICKKQINSAADKVYKRSILKEYNLRFPEGCRIAEDRAFNIAYSLYISSMIVSNHYYYFVDAASDDSLSRTVRSADELSRFLGTEVEYFDLAVSGCSLDSKYVDKIIAADNFCTCRQVYSRAKRMVLRGVEKKEIISGIREDCKEMNSKNYTYPRTLYCMKIYMPVKLRLYRLIYEVAVRLAERS